jgi:DeoR/GlpR family transcriptional regulator of sugar metabolism
MFGQLIASMVQLIISMVQAASYDAAKASTCKILQFFSKRSKIFSKRGKTLEDFKEYDKRLETNKDAKRKIAKAVVEDVLINKYDFNGSILLDTGSVTYYIGDVLMESGRGLIVTNNLGLYKLYETKEIPYNLHVIPGNMDREVLACVGSQAASSARQFLTSDFDGIPRVKIAVLGLRAYDPREGFVENTLALTEFQATMFEHAETLIVVAQGEKFLNKGNMPILESGKFQRLLKKRSEDRSLWFIYHSPTCELEDNQKKYYRNNLNDFLKKIPHDLIIQADSISI